MTAIEAKQRGRTPPGSVLMESANDDGLNFLIKAGDSKRRNAGWRNRHF